MRNWKKITAAVMGLAAAISFAAMTPSTAYAANTNGTDCNSAPEWGPAQTFTWNGHHGSLFTFYICAWNPAWNLYQVDFGTVVSADYTFASWLCSNVYWTTSNWQQNGCVGHNGAYNDGFNYPNNTVYAYSAAYIYTEFAAPGIGFGLTSRSGTSPTLVQFTGGPQQTPADASDWCDQVPGQTGNTYTDWPYAHC
jgi:hypothetical protein